MSDLSPFDYERIVIGYLLVYPDAVKYILPDLTHDKFLYSKEGSLTSSKDHLRIFQAITYLHFVDKLPITPVNILQRLNEEKGSADYLHYLNSLETALHGYYRIRDFDPRTLMSYAERVDKAGVVYRAAVKSHKLAKLIDSPEAFAKAVGGEIGDVTQWLKDFVSDVSSVISPKAQGYQHISSSVEKTLITVDRIHRGEQLTLLPVGMPSVHLPLGKLVVLMAESNAGKSIVSHQWALGTAIGLKRFGMQGCVAVNSMEEDEESLTMKMAAVLAGIDLFQFRYGNGISDHDKYRLERALEYVATLPIYLDPTNMIAASVMDFRVAGLHSSEFGPVWHHTIDYIELFDLNAEDTDNKEQALDRVIHKAFQITRQTGANAVMLSQVSHGNSGNSKFRIAGPDGTRYSKALRHAADLIYEWWNPIELKRSGIDFTVPEYLNDSQPWLLCTKHRAGPKYDPTPYGWDREHQRIFDLELNRSGNLEIELFTHPIPSFEEVEAGF